MPMHVCVCTMLSTAHELYIQSLLSAVHSLCMEVCCAVCMCAHFPAHICGLQVLSACLGALCVLVGGCARGSTLPNEPPSQPLQMHVFFPSLPVYGERK